MDGTEQTPVVTSTHHCLMPTFVAECCVKRDVSCSMLCIACQIVCTEIACTAATTAAAHHCRRIVHCCSPILYAHIVQEVTQECMHLTVVEDAFNQCMNAHILDTPCHPQSCHHHAAGAFLKA